MINYLQHSQIDKVKWDKCIERSHNRLVYASSWYLDIVSPGWEALVDNNYQTVMPLLVKNKFGLKYLVQPVFTQQLGVFSGEELTPTKVTEYLHTIPKKFFRQVFNLNYANVLPSTNQLTDRINYELDLNRNYAEISSNFNENTQRNIRKATNSGILINRTKDIELFISNYLQFAKEKPNNFGLGKLRIIIASAIDNQRGKIVFARNRAGDVIAGTFFLTDFGRIIYVISFTTLEGMESSAMFHIIDDTIKENAQHPIILDFEGSMIPGVARFFAGFGAEKKIYQQYRKGF